MHRFNTYIQLCLVIVHHQVRVVRPPPTVHLHVDLSSTRFKINPFSLDAKNVFSNTWIFPCPFVCVNRSGATSLSEVRNVSV